MPAALAPPVAVTSPPEMEMSPQSVPLPPPMPAALAPPVATIVPPWMQMLPQWRSPPLPPPMPAALPLLLAASEPVPRMVSVLMTGT